MSFKNQNYLIIRRVISEELTDFLFNYFKLKREVINFLKNERFISPYSEWLGHWGDPQVPNTYSNYADIAMENLLLKVKPIMEEKSNIKLIETYSYARIYKKGDVLQRHKDRFSCEISSTLNLGGDQWPIFLEPTGEKEKEGIKIELNPGDMLMYRGCLLEHWREEFKGETCAQVFLHYNDASSLDAEKNKHDTRPFLGLPSFFKK
jgi:hypothetical protein